MLQLNSNIKLIRELSGKKQGDFAKLIKTNLSNLKTYENTSVKPKADVLFRIAEYAGIEIQMLKEKKLEPRDIHFKVEKVDSARETLKEPVPIYEPANIKQALDIIQDLTRNNGMLSEAQLLLARKINSGDSVSTFRPSSEQESGEQIVERIIPLDRPRKRSPLKQEKKKDNDF